MTISVACFGRAGQRCVIPRTTRCRDWWGDADDAPFPPSIPYNGAAIHGWFGLLGRGGLRDLYRRNRRAAPASVVHKRCQT